MGFTRRDFLKVCGSVTAGALLTPLGDLIGPSRVFAKTLRTKWGVESSTICPYCGVGCGLIVTAYKGRVTNTEGDPDHPINEGTLCSKGNALFQVANNPLRLKTVRYRAPGSDQWEEKSWEWALDKIAHNIKKTRDESFVVKDGNNVVNRTEGIAVLGGAALDSEECYLLSKFARGLGVTYLEHQARI
jgi:anaerobic selenocysteine-containing dehydrogenase